MPWPSGTSRVEGLKWHPNPIIVVGEGFKVWDGSDWNSHPVKVWTGSAWEVKPLKRWTGTDWV